MCITHNLKKQRSLIRKFSYMEMSVLTEEQKDILLEMDDIINKMDQVIQPLRPEIQFLNTLWAQYLNVYKYVDELEKKLSTQVLKKYEDSDEN